jgi:hypothetical protein
MKRTSQTKEDSFLISLATVMIVFGIFLVVALFRTDQKAEDDMIASQQRIDSLTRAMDSIRVDYQKLMNENLTLSYICDGEEELALAQWILGGGYNVLVEDVEIFRTESSIIIRGRK